MQALHKAITRFNGLNKAAGVSSQVLAVPRRTGDNKMK